MMKSFYTALLCLFLASPGLAQHKNNCELLGHVVNDKEEHLPFVTVVLKENNIIRTTDAKGHFIFTDLKPGTYTIAVQSMGYKSYEEKIALACDKTTDLVIRLQESALEIDALVVSANRTETSRKETPVIVGMLSPKTLELTNSGNLAEGLVFLSGLRVENNCQNCGFQQVRINGLDGHYTQILIDSRPIVSALTGVYGIEQIPAGMVDRVEVLRGSSSAIYGSNAIGGSVNIITKEPLRNSLALSHNLNWIGGASAENITSINASLVNDSYTAGAYVFGNINHRNPYDADGDGYTELARIKGSTIGFRGYYKPTKFSKLTLEYHNINENRRGGNNMDLQPQEADIAEQAEHDINGGGLKYDLFSSDYKHRLSVYGSLQNTDRNSYYGAGKDPNAFGKTTDLTYDAGVQYGYTFDKLWFMPANLIVGAEFNSDHLIDNMPSYKRSTDQTADMASLFLQNEWKNDQWSFLLGGRLDKQNMIDYLIFSPRINLRFNPIPDVGLRVGYSEGFRAPQVFSEDLHVLAAGGAVVLTSLAPGLRPETSHSFNASVDLYHSFGEHIQGNLLIDGFYTKLKDVFILEPNGHDEQGNTLMLKTNGAGAVVKGFNIEAKVAFTNNYQLQAGFTAQQSEYTEPYTWSETAEPVTKMLRTPDLYGYLTAMLTPVRNLTASVSAVYTGSMLVPHMAGYIPADRTEETPGFFDAGFKLAYDFKLKGGITLQLFGGMKNVFNSYQSDFDQGPDRDSGYMYGPIYPRSGFGGLKVML